MSEEKSEDTKSPMARRGARPFAGPATGAPGARPFLRPATPSQRPVAAPFTPGARRSGPSPAAAIAPVASPSVAPSLAARALPPVTVAPEIAAAEESSLPVAGGLAPTTEHVSAPHDPFDAFDAAWATPEPPTQAGIEPSTIPAPLDGNSLGSDLDAPEAWAQEITSAAEAIAQAGESAPTDSPAADSRPVTPSLGVPPWLADVQPAAAERHPSVALPKPIQDPTPDTATWSPIEADASYSAADWSDLAALPAAEEIVASVSEPITPYAPDQSLGAPPAADWSEPSPSAVEPVASRFELVEEPPVTRATADSRTLHGWRVSSALDRLAERVRSGEIDVSSVAPEANDAAVLASVLAALLGGSSSR